MDVQFIILLCLIVVRQTTADNINDMEAKVKQNCIDTGSNNCKAVSKTFDRDTRDGQACNSGIYPYRNTITEEPPTPTSTMLLWSGCGMKDEATHIKKYNSTYMTVDKTTIGKSFKNLHWKKVGNDIEFEESEDNIAEYWQTDYCSYPFEYGFWALLSQEFAYRARGVVNVILSARSIADAYDPKSIFALYEVPNLPTNTLLRVYFYDAKEMCTNCKKDDSIQVLKNLVEKRGMDFECYSGREPPANYKESSKRYEGPECNGCLMKLPSNILVAVSSVHLFIERFILRH